MKIELQENKVLFNNGLTKQEIHPFWLRERISEEKYLDKGTNQRLFDPASLDSEIKIKEVKIKDNFLEIKFTDGVNSKVNLDKIASEFSGEDNVLKPIDKIKWDSKLKDVKKPRIVHAVSRKAV